LPEGARFCPSCGAPVRLSATERRAVTILFADLVGFTDRSDDADPEDVRRTLVPFHRLVQREVERFGGTLDKFIGDAAMGVFGAPIAHGDDPDRAVRAGLAVLEGVASMRREDPTLAVRVAVETGEAVVAAGSGPQVGEAVAGDVVNTASRMQALAPPMGLVVGAETYLAVRDRFRTEELPPASVKGKRAPLRVWRVLGQGPARAVRARFVGRARELSELRARLDEAARTGTARTATIVAGPGVGKTRLLAELRDEADARWLQGACVPSGEGVTFRPIERILRQALGSADADVTEALERRLLEIEPHAGERRWLGARLAPLLGSDAREPSRSQAISPVELALACGRLLSSDRPSVVAVEDLHWAEPVLLELLEGLAETLAETPVLFVATARPQLLERHPSWDAEAVIRLPELSVEESRELITDLVARASVPEEALRELIERAGGNPLFAVEYARLVAEGGTRERIPPSVRAMIEARLDALGPEHRGVLLDASVLGTGFSPELLRQVGGERATTDALDALERHGMLERSEEGIGFSHALIRDVAYGRLPRLERARRHLDAARWLEANDRGNLVGLAHHLRLATELAVAGGDQRLAQMARPDALRWGLAEADAATHLDPRGAFESFERVLGLAPAGSAERARALAGSGLAGRRTGTLVAGEVLARYEEALQIHRGIGDPVEIGSALVRLGSQLATMGHGAEAAARLDEAIPLLESAPPGRALANAYAFRAEEAMFAGRDDESLVLAERALRAARAAGAPDVEIMALHIRGDARCARGDPGGLVDLDESLERGEGLGWSSHVVTSYTYLADWRWQYEGPRAGIELYGSAIAVAQAHGLVSGGLWARAGALWPMFEAGEWDSVLEEAETLLAIEPDRIDRQPIVAAGLVRGLVLALRDQRDEVGDVEELVALAILTDELQEIGPALALSGSIRALDGDRAGAAERFAELEERTRGVSTVYRASNAPALVRGCLAIGTPEIAARIVDEATPRVRRERLLLEAAAAALAELREGPAAAEPRLGAAADELAAFGVPLEEAFARRARARCLEALERAEAAARERAAASALFERLGVTGPALG
jgi:class 3 adenylate cyclase/tetratricopeptide (TPR) repeat protein